MLVKGTQSSNKVRLEDEGPCKISYRPKTLLTLSAIIIAVGTFVFTYTTAPSLSRISTSEELLVASVSANAANPTELAFPAMLKLSFNDIGTPCKGPVTLPVLA